MKWEAGVTLIELLIVIAIIAILGASTTPFLSQFILRNNIETSTDKVIGTIRKAQGYAMDKKNEETWGICISDGSVRLYSDTCSSPTHSEDFAIPSTISITGLNDTTFDIRGEPSSTLSISINSSIESRSVDINSSGGMDIN